MIIARGEFHIRHAVHMFRRRDVEHRQPRDPIRIVGGQTMGDTPTPVMADDGVAIKPQVRHQARQVPRHGALGIGRMVRVRRRLAAVAVTAQIGHDQGVMPRHQGRQLVPHGMGLRIAVQQQNRRPLASRAEIDGDATDLPAIFLKAVEHQAVPCLPCDGITCSSAGRFPPGSSTGPERRDPISSCGAENSRG